jgi:hypothetical protein
MANGTDAALRRIVMEFDVFSSAFDRYMHEVDTAVCELDESTFDGARHLVADAVDVSLFLRDAALIIDRYRTLCR